MENGAGCLELYLLLKIDEKGFEMDVLMVSLHVGIEENCEFEKKR